MLLNEQIFERSDVIKEGLPKGVLARVWYKIMRFGKKNANKRVYERKVAEAVLSDKDIKKKLETRTLYGDQEHPELSQVKLDWQKTSHIIPEMRINESDNTLEAAFDILPTEPGKFINILLEAGCQVGVSTRADGELEEALDEAGEKYSRVIPEKYVFRSVDFTGDPSTPNTVPERIIRATQDSYEAKTIDKNVAMALLEYVNTPESKSLLEIVKNDKQHTGCKCSLKEKKCSGGCSHNSATPAKLTESVKIGSIVKVNEKRGIIAHIFPRTQKAIVQFTDCKESVKLSECCLLEELNPISSEMEQASLKLFNKSYKDLTFQEKEQVLAAESTPATPPAPPSTPSASSQPIVPPVTEIPPTEPETGFYKDGKGELLFVKEVKDGNVIVARQTGKEEKLSVEQFLSLEATKAKETGFPERQPDEEKKERFEMEEAINKALAAKVNEGPAAPEADPEKQSEEISDVDFEGKLWQKPVEFLKGLSPELVKTWTPEQQRIFQQVVRRKELGENKQVLETVDLSSKIQTYLSDNRTAFVSEHEAVKNLMSLFKISEASALQHITKKSEPIVAQKDITENYVQELLLKTLEIKQLQETIAELSKASRLDVSHIQETESQLTEATAKNTQVVDALQETVATVSAETLKISAKLEEAQKKNAFLVERIRTQEVKFTQADATQVKRLKESQDLVATQVRANEELRAEIKRLEESKKAELQSLKESHQRDLIKVYVESRVGGLGLKLPKQTLTLLENCSSSAEVDQTIRQTQDAIREGIVHSASISEIVQKSEIITSPMQQSINKKVENVLKNLGV